MHDRIVGYDRPWAEWNFQSLLGHVQPTARGAVAESFEQVKRTGEAWHFEAPILCANGVERWIIVHARMEGSRDGRRRCTWAAPSTSPAVNWPKSTERMAG